MLNIINFQGIYGNNKDIPTGISIESIAKTGIAYNWKIKQHVHNELFQFFIIKNGEGVILNGEDRKPFIGPCFIIIPKNTIHGFEFTPGIRGRVISMPDYLLERLLQEEYRVFELVDRMHFWQLDLDKTIDKAIYDLLHNCDWEYSTDLPGKKLLVQTYIIQLFILISRLPIMGEFQLHGLEKNRVSQKIFREFVHIIRKEDAPARKSIGAYASMLNITSNQLNRICNTIAGKSSKDILSDYVLNEAKSLLKNSMQTISEISCQLHFDSPAYFTRFFKSKMGFSPKEYKIQKASY